MPLDYMRTRRRVEPLSVLTSTDFSKTYTPAIYDSLTVKWDGIMGASGAGTNALDGPFGAMGRVEWVLGDEPIIVMAGSDIRHLASIMCGGHAEILPTGVGNGVVFLAQAELPLRKFISNAGIDARSRDLVVRGRTGLAAQMGTTCTSITSSKLRFSGETVAVQDGVHYQPVWLSQTIDVSTSSPDLKGRFTIGTDFTTICGLFFRQHDASAALTDPNAARADSLVKEIRVVLNSGGKEREIGRATWGELKFQNTSKWGISAATGQISTGVAFMEFHDHEHPETDYNPVFMKGDVITVYADTSATVENEFISGAVTNAAGDLLYYTPITFVPKGDLVEAAIARAKQTPDYAQRISDARARAQRLQG